MDPVRQAGMKRPGSGGRVRDIAHLQNTIDRLSRAGTVTGTKTLMVVDHWTRR